MGKFIETNGNVSDTKPKNGTDYQLSELKKFVGGYIEIVRLNDSEIMVVNEDSMRDKQINELATVTVAFLCDYHVTIYGDVLICNSEEVV